MEEVVSGGPVEPDDEPTPQDAAVAVEELFGTEPPANGDGPHEDEPGPAKGAVQRMQQEIQKLKRDVQDLNKVKRELAEVRWCFVEYIWKQKMAMAQQALQNPQVQEQLAQALAARMP
jgi:hypothetical protein